MPEHSLSKIIAVVLFATTVLSLYSTAIPRVFCLIPAHTFSVHIYPWNVLTYIFVEPNPILSACGIACMLTLGMMVETALGTPPFLQLVMVNAIITAVVILTLSALLHQVGFSWFFQCYSGIWSTLAAILVPWVAFSPSSWAIPRLFSIHLQRQHLPTALLLFAIIVDLVFRRRQKISEDDVDSTTVFPGSVFIPTFVGLCVSWALQGIFHPKSPVTFQVLLQPILSSCHAFPSISKRYNTNTINKSSAGSVAALNNTVSIPVLRNATNVTLLPGSTEEDAERRRSIALAALNSKLQETVFTNKTRRDAFV